LSFRDYPRHPSFSTVLYRARSLSRHLFLILLVLRFASPLFVFFFPFSLPELIGRAPRAGRHQSISAPPRRGAGLLHLPFHSPTPMAVGQRMSLHMPLYSLRLGHGTPLCLFFCCLPPHLIRPNTESLPRLSFLSINPCQVPYRPPLTPHNFSPLPDATMSPLDAFLFRASQRCTRNSWAIRRVGLAVNPRLELAITDLLIFVPF